ncbi:Lipoprotein [Caenorhabditis elegans]|uniref:Lipoprotein n=1 Tax=Caenorhabditis elegans TaxID=6239 RepID=D3KFW3_CAEEL|nr:Lipoprotein [Caenorhabditis elegans]CBJ25091.1 Lipoprotein [Caenorhabditis elegans]|eukprot:NP_001254242.1 Uncharacterized protein CELE_M02G9.4 [Caenorhabditis elegans]
MDFTGPPYGKWNEQLGANATNQTDQKAKILVDSMLNGKSDNQQARNIASPTHTNCSNFR